jgi:hypothetical protein
MAFTRPHSARRRRLSALTLRTTASSPIPPVWPSAPTPGGLFGAFRPGAALQCRPRAPRRGRASPARAYHPTAPAHPAPFPRPQACGGRARRQGFASRAQRALDRSARPPGSTHSGEKGTAEPYPFTLPPPRQTMKSRATMLTDAVDMLVAALEPADLAPLRSHLAAIVEARNRADAGGLCQWHSMSTLELSGIVAMLQHRLSPPRPQSPPPCYNASRRRACRPAAAKEPHERPAASHQRRPHPGH